MKYLLYITTMLGLFHSLALTANPLKPGQVEVELISEMTHIRPGEIQWFALTQKIEPGWHTYWRNPGDSGASTSLVWKLPAGFEAGDIQWPVPEAIPYGPLLNYGYHDQVVLPVAVSIPQDYAGDSLVIKVLAEWLVCADICIPEEAELELTLAVSQAPLQPDLRQVDDFTLARQLTPKNIGIDSDYRLLGKQIEINIKIPDLSSERIQEVRYFPYSDGLIDYPSDQSFIVKGSQLKLIVKQGYIFNAGNPADPEKLNLDGVLVIEEVSGERLSTSFEISPKRQPKESKSTAGSSLNNPSDSAAKVNLFSAFLYAFLGGMILNLMPCVFPVLSIKVLSLVKHQDTSPGQIKIHGLVYLAGVVLSFVAIATILILLRAGGAQIGWGFQLQNPIVVSLLVYLFFVIGLNLSGVFEIGLNLMNMGGSLTQKEGYSGSFFTGVLATVVAAPCTAPFMGAAIGFALTQSGLSALLVFAALGLGMGLPYVLLCYSPGLLQKLPKAGSWMEGFKEFLAFPMYASAIWLIWVLSLQAGSDGVIITLVGILLLGFSIWLITGASGWGWKRIVNLILGVAAICAALAMPFKSFSKSQPVPANGTASGPADTGDSANNHSPGDYASSNSYAGPSWQVYSPELLQQLRQKGPVFVNFTAAWCITCKVNEAVALDSVTMKQAFNKAGIIYLKGDWTNEDPLITAALAEYGRSGVPLYLLYPQGSKKAEVLPQILTENIVQDAINRL